MESLIAAVVLAIAVVGISGTLVATSQQAQDVDDSAVVNALARELMEEIVAKPLMPPTSGNVLGWTGGNKDRTTYDSTSDFNGYSDVSPFKSIGGKLVDPNTGQTYTRTVSFEYRVDPKTPFSTEVTEVGLLDGIMRLLLNPARELDAALAGGLVATSVEITSDFGFVIVKVTSTSGRYVMLNRLVCNTTYKK